MSTRRTNRRGIREQRRGGQRGSALLIVLVFAAIVAIMLYRELPVAAFEAQRQKEELLVSRGNEYKRGVRLFVRKVGRFPSSIAELEDTNRMRFLRRRYVDPLTGKDDWRLIHAGPGGVITDSQVKKTGPNAPGSNPLGQGAVFAGFNNTFTGDTTAAANEAADKSNAGLRKRAAATQNEGVQTNDPLTSIAAGTDPNGQNSSAAGGGSAPGQAGGQFAAASNGSSVPEAGGSPQGGTPTGISTPAQQLNNINPQTPEKSPAQVAASMGNTAAFGNNSSTNGAGNGLIGGAGGIAGVASVAPGKSIKTVNDQSKYKLWEFYYDLSKEQSGAMQAALGGQGNQNANGNANATSNGSFNNGGFFGQSSQTNQNSSGTAAGGQSGATSTPASGQVLQPQQ